MNTISTVRNRKLALFSVFFLNAYLLIQILLTAFNQNNDNRKYVFDNSFVRKNLYLQVEFLNTDNYLKCLNGKVDTSIESLLTIQSFE